MLVIGTTDLKMYNYKSGASKRKEKNEKQKKLIKVSHLFSSTSRLPPAAQFVSRNRFLSSNKDHICYKLAAQSKTLDDNDDVHYYMK